MVEPARRDFRMAIGARRPMPEPGRQGGAALCLRPLVIARDEFRVRLPAKSAPSRQGGIVNLRHLRPLPQYRLRLLRPGSGTSARFRCRGFRRETTAQTALRLHRRGLLWNSGNSFSRPTCCCRRWRLRVLPWLPAPKRPSARPRRPARPVPGRQAFAKAPANRSTTPSWSAPTNAGVGGRFRWFRLGTWTPARYRRRRLGRNVTGSGRVDHGAQFLLRSDGR